LSCGPEAAPRAKSFASALESRATGVHGPLPAFRPARSPALPQRALVSFSTMIGLCCKSCQANTGQALQSRQMCASFGLRRAIPRAARTSTLPARRSTLSSVPRLPAARVWQGLRRGLGEPIKRRPAPQCRACEARFGAARPMSCSRRAGRRDAEYIRVSAIARFESRSRTEGKD